MPPRVDARVVYLIAFPFDLPADSPARTVTFTKSAPYFQALDTEITELGVTEIMRQSVPVTVRRQVIDDQVQSLECHYALADAFSPAGNALKQRLQTELREHVLREAGYAGPFVEEYTAFCVTHPDRSPDEFVNAHCGEIATLLRTEARTFTTAEAEQILNSRARYADTDLTVVDWEGALIIDPEADFQSEIELLKLGNYQILRYRLLDRAIERSLEAVRQELHSKRRFGLGNRAVREALEKRLELLLDFEKSEQLLLLIGDWYTAQLYRLIVDEFYIDEWKGAVHDKLDQLESITDTVRANFALTWEQTLDLVQLVGWLVLLVGYFVLFYLDVIAAGK
jgi:hypothetical protein